MGKIAKRHVEGRAREERIAVRKQIGPLSNITVQPRTKARYEAARQGFYKFLKHENLELPHRRQDLDPILGSVSTSSVYGHQVRAEQKPTTRWQGSKTKIRNYEDIFLGVGDSLKHGVWMKCPPGHLLYRRTFSWRWLGTLYSKAILVSQFLCWLVSTACSAPGRFWGPSVPTSPCPNLAMWLSSPWASPKAANDKGPLKAPLWELKVPFVSYGNGRNKTQWGLLCVLQPISGEQCSIRPSKLLNLRILVSALIRFGEGEPPTGFDTMGRLINCLYKAVGRPQRPPRST